MTRRIEIAPEIEAVLGAEQVTRMREPGWGAEARCWECGARLDDNEPATILLLRPRDVSQLTFAVCAHPQCSSSQIREPSREEIQAHRARLEGVDDTPGSRVDVVTAVWDTGEETHAVVAVSYPQEIITGAGPERTNLLISLLLGRGWHLAGDVVAPPGPAPNGWELRFTPSSDSEDSVGLLEIVDPAHGVTTSAITQPAPLWRPAIARTGKAIVYMGPGFLSNRRIDGIAAIEHAAHTGSLVGAVLPAAVLN